MNSTVSRFTPSNAPADLLERRFVGRHAVLDDIADRIARFATHAEQHHTLIVGPSGAGKTHLVALADSRAHTQASAGAAIQTAWLLENPYGIASYRDLLSEIAGRLEPSTDSLEATSIDALEAFITHRVDERGPIVLFIENLDQVLDVIDKNGQQRFARLIRSETSLLLVASTPSPRDEFADRHATFTSHFTTVELEPFDVRTAADMLSRVALDHGDQPLVDFLSSDSGRARLRAVEHLVGGQPRIWATLGQSLTVDALDELADVILTSFDDVTPYHQVQLARLSPRQQRVVLALATAGHAVSVVELADLVEVEQRSVAKTVKELADKNWIKPVETACASLLDRRKTYYELADPLARLSFQIKAARTSPFAASIEFLKYWFAPGYSSDDAGQLAVAYVRAATRATADERTGDAALTSLILDAVAALAAAARGDAEPFLRLPTWLRLALETQISGPARLVVDTELCRVQLLCETLRELTEAEDEARARTRRAFYEIAESTEVDSIRLLALTGLSVMQAVDGLADQAAASLEAASRINGQVPESYGRR